MRLHSNTPSSEAGILCLAADGYNGNGGIAEYVRMFVNNLVAPHSTMHVHLCSRNKVTDEQNPSNIQSQIYENDFSGSAVSFAFSVIRRALSMQDLKIIVCCHVNLLVVAWTLGKLLNKPVVLLTYGIEVWVPPRRFVAHMTRSLALVITISRFTRNALMELYYLEPHKIKILPNCVNLSSLNNSKYQTNSLQSSEIDRTVCENDLVQRYALNGAAVLLTVGRVSSSERYKGHAEVICALPDIRQQIPHVRYVVVGGGDDISRLKNLAQSVGVYQLVVFTGHIPAQEIKLMYGIARCFVMPSSKEGFGFVYLEAARAGLPVVGGGLRGAKDALLEGELGTMVDASDHVMLVQSIVKSMGRKKSVPVALGRFGTVNFRDHLHACLAPWISCIG